ncbi:MAG TPA: thioredoxin domain-containing protein [Verrucomicrobiae bacterium]|jgi:protein disulfide-isomerase|nr:thioredoxin domain-containing protein [Verrucomicrobiae bacterium]
MKKGVVTFLAAMLFWQANAADAGWLTDLPQAEAQAKAENKIVLMDFSGSDWCPECIALKKKVFDTEKFQAYAATNVVLVNVDFPDKKPQSSDLKKANADLKDKYNVAALPTLVVLDQNGKEVGRPSDSDEDSVKALIAALEKYKAAK